MSHGYFIRESPRRVFEAISSPECLVKWLADRAEVVPSKGGRYLLGWNGGPTHVGTLAEFRRGKIIAFSWNWPGVDLRGTVLRLSVKAKGQGTLLKVEHIGFPREERWVELYGGAEWGWAYFAMNLKSVLETGHDLRSEFDG